MHLTSPVVALATLALLTPALPAQQTRVDFPDSAIAAPPQLLFPFYTLGSGGTVRYQTMCPATFPGLPSQPMLVTGLGLQIAGQERYDRFEIRFGATPATAISSCWTTNLPDQRLQHDLSGTVLPGGLQNGAAVNQWVELELAFPFVWTPGEGLTLDIVSSATTSGSWCSTAAADHARVYSAPFSGGTCGSIDPTGGLKFRVVFEPIDFVPFGQGCAGTGGFLPAIDATGSSQLGGSPVVQLTSGLGGSPAALFFGCSRTEASFGTLPFAFGGGCDVWTSSDVAVPTLAGGSGAGQGTASVTISIPNLPALRNAVVFAQWAQLDAASPAAVPVVTSDALAIIAH